MAWLVWGAVLVAWLRGAVASPPSWGVVAFGWVDLRGWSRQGCGWSDARVNRLSACVFIARIGRDRLQLFVTGMTRGVGEFGNVAYLCRNFVVSLVHHVRFVCRCCFGLAIIVQLLV